MSNIDVEALVGKFIYIEGDNGSKNICLIKEIFPTYVLCYTVSKGASYNTDVLRYELSIKPNEEVDFADLDDEIEGTWIYNWFPITEDYAKLAIKKWLEEYQTEIAEYEPPEVKLFGNMKEFFDHFSWINASALAREIGIHPTVMRQYKSGACDAGRKRKKVIQDAVHKLAAELREIRLV